MQYAHAILGLLAHTSIHAGTGSHTGNIIDLPIQREGHNNWPCIFGSAIKGAIRTRAEDSLNLPELEEKPNPSIKLIFGAEANEIDTHAGAVAFSDARLLLFPVRSLTSQFKWVTCPAALRRYQKDKARLGQEIDFKIPTHLLTKQDRALIPNGQQANTLFLEEYRFKEKPANLVKIIEEMVTLMQGDDAELTLLLRKQLVIVSDDMFSYIVQHATPVNAHIRIESETKMVTQGALWYEETLPPETLLYVTLSGVKARSTENLDVTQTAQKMLEGVLDLFPPKKEWLQVGGNETVGMGWCAISVNKIEK